MTTFSGWFTTDRSSAADYTSEQDAVQFAPRPPAFEPTRLEWYNEADKLTRRQLMQSKRFDPRWLAITAVMIAIVFVLTRVIQIPTPAKGYIHLGDAGVFFSAFAFGPWIGALAGGLGTALADAAGGYPQWAAFSFLIHGAQGLVVGWLVRRWPSIWGLIAAAVAGGSSAPPRRPASLPAHHPSRRPALNGPGSILHPNPASPAPDRKPGRVHPAPGTAVIRHE
jgi:hypothetical protein